jgi:mono/diheme cytochrome c family protein
MIAKVWMGALVLAAVATAGCEERIQPPTASGAGGDAVIPTSPLCNGVTSGGKDMTGGITTEPGFASPFQPQFGANVAQPVAPPAISGGTLRVLRDGHTAVAADPDRDRVYLVDLASREVTTVMLTAGDEPGRVVEDAAGRAHVALRRGGAVVTIDVAAGVVSSRRAVCAAPRGMAYDPAMDLLHVACSEGSLVSLPAGGGDAVRTVALPRDVRDVVVDGSRLRVSRFLSAELLTVEADGSVSGRITHKGWRAASARGGQLFTAGVAWKMTEMPDGGVMMLHQRGVVDEVHPTVGGYGGPDTCGGIVHPAVTMIAPDGSMRSGPAMTGMVLAVDMAVSADGQRVAFVAAGNSTNGGPQTGVALPRVFMSDTESTTDPLTGCKPDGKHGPCSNVVSTMGGTRPPTGSTSTGAAGSSGGTQPCGVPDPEVPQVVGEPIAIAFDGTGALVIQSREPAMLTLGRTGYQITLSTESRADTGHLIFHSNAGSGLACASCHAEGNDDGRVWSFTCEGQRRTQSLQTGLRGTEPFHWSGNESDINRLMADVFVGRMLGPTLASDQADMLLTWIDSQPRPLRPAPADAAAVERGRALFNDPQRGACASCHSGARFTNSQTVDVGTGGAFQVPSLVGIGSRGPFMHNGCAKTLTERFGPCGGGDRHGITSTMTGAEIADLVTFLGSI